MKPTVPPKLCSIAFAVLWTCGMVLSSGAIDRVNIIIMSVCGALAGVGWYFAMRWVFQFIELLPPHDQG
jgi:hypothetical protein